MGANITARERSNCKLLYETSPLAPFAEMLATEGFPAVRHEYRNIKKTS